MRRTLMAAAAVAVMAGGTILGGASPASAGGQALPLECGNMTFQIVTNGNGDWTPGRVKDGSGHVLHPTSFGEVHGTVVFKDGSGSDEFTDPPMARTNTPPNGKATFTDCTFSVDFEDAYVTGHFEGTVSGWIS